MSQNLVSSMHRGRAGTVINAAIRMERRRPLRPLLHQEHQRNHQQSVSGWVDLPLPLPQPVHLDLANTLHADFVRRAKNVRFLTSGIPNRHLQRSRASFLPQERVQWDLFVCLNMSSLSRQRSRLHRVLDDSPEVYVKPHKSRANYSLPTSIGLQGGADQASTKDRGPTHSDSRTNPTPTPPQP